MTDENVIIKKEEGFPLTWVLATVKGLVCLLMVHIQARMDS